MDEMAWRDALAFRPDIVVVKLGTNDSKPENWQYKAEFKHDLQQLITTLRTKSSPKVYLCTPIPAIKSTCNISDSIIVSGIIPIQREVAKANGIHIIDLHTLFANDADKMLSDGIHPNVKGARRLAEIIAREIVPKN